MDELVYGVFRAEAVAYFQQVIGRLKKEGCDCVVLGCTEIPLIVDDTNSPLPTLDSTRLLARAALRRAVEGTVYRLQPCEVGRGASHRVGGSRRLTEQSQFSANRKKTRYLLIDGSNPVLTSYRPSGTPNTKSPG